MAGGRHEKLKAMRLPALAQLSRLTRLMRLILEDAMDVREAKTDVPALAALTNLQVLPPVLPLLCAFVPCKFMRVSLEQKYADPLRIVHWICRFLATGSSCTKSFVWT